MAFIPSIGIDQKLEPITARGNADIEARRASVGFPKTAPPSLFGILLRKNCARSRKPRPKRGAREEHAAAICSATSRWAQNSLKFLGYFDQRPSRAGLRTWIEPASP
jgi:hypothetical protein